MSLTPEYGPYNPITALAGESTATTCKIVICTMNDPAVNAVTFICNGVTYTDGVDFDTNMTAVGTDRGSLFTEAGWVGALTVSGLPSTFQRFTWQVIQGTNRDSGSFTNSPDAREDFVLYAGTCDNNTNFSNQNNNHPWANVGYWKRIKSLIESGVEPECAGLLMVDDVMGYVDGKSIDDSADSGHWATGVPQTTLKEYDYFIAWFAMLGMLGETVDVSATTNAKLLLLWGREVNRAWCRKNMNWRVGYGDHELKSDFGWDEPVAAPSALHATGTNKDGAGFVAYNTIFGAINPAAISGASDTLANHWATDIGCLTVAYMDGVTNSTTTGLISYGAAPTAITNLYGSNQIDDVLGALNTGNTSFKILMLPLGMRYIMPLSVNLGENDSGTQHPIYNHCIAEYKQLFTADNNGSNPSIMDGVYTNGAKGTTIVLFGDHHVGMVQKHHSSADTNILAEQLYEFHLGTMNGSINFKQDSPIDTDYEFTNGTQKTTVEHMMDLGTEYGLNTFQGHRMIVSGSKAKPELRMIIEDAFNNVVWDKKFIKNCGNLAYETTIEPIGTSSGSNAASAGV